LSGAIKRETGKYGIDAYHVIAYTSATIKGDAPMSIARSPQIDTSGLDCQAMRASLGNGPVRSVHPRGFADDGCKYSLGGIPGAVA
jgi:hypothetical protein